MDPTMIETANTDRGSRPAAGTAPSPSALIDRLEGRIGLAAVDVRDLGLDLATLAGGTEPVGPRLATPQEARRLADEVRAAVGREDLRFFAALAHGS